MMTLMFYLCGYDVNALFDDDYSVTLDDVQINIYNVVVINIKECNNSIINQMMFVVFGHCPPFC